MPKFALETNTTMATKKGRMKAEAKYPDLSEYRFSLGFYVFKERENFIAYCPSLDLSTSGNNFNEAVANFYECFQLYLECNIEDGTLYDDLVALGWKLQTNAIQPPTFANLMKKKEMKSLMGGDINFERIVTPARFSMAL